VARAPGPFRFECEGAHIPEHENLAWKAAKLLGVDLSGLHVLLRKRIPLQAGLGGGSADAAAMLHLVADEARAQGHAVTDEMLVRFAASLGSDVAACLFRGFKMVEGAGERVRPLAMPAPSWGIVLLQPDVRVATSDAYRLLDETRGVDVPRPSGALDVLIAALGAGDFALACAHLHNDFEPVISAAFPAIAAAGSRLRDAGASETLLCGSGSCVAGFFESVDAAQRAHGRLQAGASEWCRVTTLAE
jgi:4-diphosphocytidyl-2-C-methyl-D-erythritol kinase